MRNRMIAGKKCDYSERYFYAKGDYIYSKSNDKIVDIVARVAVYVRRYL